MSESGINLDFDSFLDEEEVIGSQGPFYELQSKPISPQEGELKNATMTTRTALKMQLMKQQLEHETRRQSQQAGDRPQQQYRPPQPQTESIPAPSSSQPKEVPPHVLEVRTPLLNPTRYHVEHNQKRQLEMYLHQDHSFHQYTQSLPSNAALQTGDTASSAPNLTSPNSLPTHPDSPHSVGVSSTATSVSEVDDILGDIMNLESVDPSNFDNELNFIEPTLMSQTLPHNTQQYLEQFTQQPSSTTAKSASSCPAEVNGAKPSGYHGGRIREDQPPPFMNQDELQQWHKDRQKKDNHNLIERRRRFNINDRIKELGTLLPKGMDPFKGNPAKYYDMRQNKGTILKASVDYIRMLKRDQEQMRMMEDQKRQLETTNRKMLLRIQELEMKMQQAGVSQQVQRTTTSDFLTEMLKTTQPNLDFIKQETESPLAGSPSMEGIEDCLEDSTLLCNDPMISLSSPAVEQHSRRSSGAVSMEETAEMLG